MLTKFRPGSQVEPNEAARMLERLNQWKERYFTRPWHFLRAMRAAKGLRRQRFWAILRRRFPLPRWLKRRRQGIWLSCDHPFFDNRRRPILSGIVAFHGWAVA